MDTASVFLKPRESGYNVLSLFSGIGSDLEALLQSGYTVANYWAVEIHPTARRVSESRYQQLLLRHPGQISQEAVAQVHTRLPQDVELISEADIRDLGGVDLLIAGWPCQGHSKAGSGQGFWDPRSRLYVEIVRIIEILQQTQARPLGYLLENVFSGFDHRAKVIAAWKLIHQTFGECVMLDAAQFGSYAHRLRAYWTNLMPVALIRGAVSLWPRMADDYVDDILDPGRTSAPVTTATARLYFPCNVVGQKRRALPTFVSFPNSHAYRVGQAGILWDVNTQSWDTPNADERERAMGFYTGTTRLKGVTEPQRRELLGEVMDVNALT